MYPCWRYRELDGGMEGKVIFSADEETRLGGVWFSTPTELEQSKVEKMLKNTALDSDIPKSTQLKVVRRKKS